MFIINPRKETSIYKAWRTNAEKQLCNMFHDIRESGTSTHWLTDEILQALKAHLDSPEFKVKQVKAQMNKGSAWRGSVDIGGSTTIECVQLRMVNIVLYSFSYSILY